MVVSLHLDGLSVSRRRYRCGQRVSHRPYTNATLSPVSSCYWWCEYPWIKTPNCQAKSPFEATPRSLFLQWEDSSASPTYTQLAHSKKGRVLAFLGHQWHCQQGDRLLMQSSYVDRASIFQFNITSHILIARMKANKTAQAGRLRIQISSSHAGGVAQQNCRGTRCASMVSQALAQLCRFLFSSDTL